MKSFYKRIISGALAFVTLFFACVPAAFASDTGSLDTPARGDFWAWAQMKGNAFKSIFDKDICPQSPNTNGRHEFVKTHTTVDGKTGLYYVCKYCGKSAGEVGEEAYQQQVSTLPATGYNSAGRLIWQCSLSDLDLEVSYFILPGAAVGSYPASYLSSLPISVSDMYGFSSNVEWDSNSCCFAVRQSGAASSLSFGFRITYPISGSYRQLGSLFYSYNAITSSGTVVNGTDSYGEVSSFGHCNSGSYFDVSRACLKKRGSSAKSTK